jgi:RNA polymerase sigma-70 factor (ECF subfamily)
MRNYPGAAEIIVAIVFNEVRPDALVAQLGSNRNAIYKTMFDARG